MVRVQRRFLGASAGEGFPVLVRECSIPQALELGLGFLNGVSNIQPIAGQSGATVHAGGGVSCERIRDWVARVSWRFQPAAASQIAPLCCRGSSALPFPLQIPFFSRFLIAEIF